MLTIDEIREAGMSAELRYLCWFRQQPFSILPTFVRVGRSLRFGGDSEKFADDPEADALLTRIYRIPYVVPDKI
jgi:hypothetical protein